MKTLLFFWLAIFIPFANVFKAEAQSSYQLTSTSSISSQGKQTASLKGGPVQNAPAGLHLKFELDSVVYDEIGVYFAKGWSDNYDQFDSFDLDGLAPKVYLSSFTADGVRVSINAMNSYTYKNKRVKLYVRGVYDGQYTLNLEDFNNIDTALFNVYLVDNQKKDSTNLITHGTYRFNVVAADTAAFSNRFVLAVELKSTLPAYKLMAFAGQKTSSGVEINWNVQNAGNYTGFVLQRLNSASGYDSLYTIQSQDSISAYTFLDPHPSLTSNVYRLQQSGLQGNITYSAPITIGFTSASPNPPISIYPNPSKSIINISVGSNSTTAPNYSADIYNTQGILVAHQAINTNTWTQDISNYKLGVYFIQLKTNGYIVGQTKFIKTN